jgi:hypothetical protein
MISSSKDAHSFFVVGWREHLAFKVGVSPLRKYITFEATGTSPASLNC